MTHLCLMDVQIEAGWKEVLKDEFEKPYFSELVHFVKEEYRKNPDRIFPKGNQIFRAFEVCPWEKLQVVILGQDPYPTRGHAHGLCFSCDEHVWPLPKSLQNIFRELEADLGIPHPKHGDLHFWAEQGVLLLNTILTVSEGTPLSHANKGWEKFTDAVIDVINRQKEGIVFVLWGSPAQRKGERVDTNRHFVLRAPHPSPLSAHRGFFESKPFSAINNELLRQGKKPIRWA